jgi:CRP/FNR family transcriptional regulator, cyclic AMP receptor protein
MSIDPADARAFPGFAHLDDRSVDDLRARVRSIHLQRGETLFRQGDRDAALYLLVEGTVDIVQATGAGDRPGDRQPVATRRARTVLGELGLLLNVPRTATVVASTDAVCWELTQHAFSSAIERSEAWAARLALAIASELARRFVDVQSEVNQLGAGANGPAHKPAELARLRTRLLAEWAF